MTDQTRTAFEDLLKSFLQSDEQLKSEQLQYLEQMINDFVVTYEQHTHLYDSTMEIDYQLVGDGIIVTDDYLTMIMDGTFHKIQGDGELDEHEGEEKHTYASLLPYHVAERGPAQIMISDYTLDSLLNTSLTLKWYDFSDEMSTAAINNYIDHFEKAFGSKTKVKVTAKPVAGTQKLSVSGSKGLTTLTGLVNVHIQNPFADREMDAVRLTVEVVAKVRINIRQDYTITGAVHDLKTNLIDFKSFFYTFATKESLSSQLEFLDPWAMSYINNLLD